MRRLLKVSLLVAAATWITFWFVAVSVIEHNADNARKQEAAYHLEELYRAHTEAIAM